MRELFHLMKKDWRYIRAWAAGCWALTIAAWAVVDIAAHPTLRHAAGLVQLLALILPLAVLARLIQRDPAVDSSAFWLTRPMSRASLLGSKLIVGGGAVIGPCLLLSVLPLAARGLDLSRGDYALAFAAMLVRYLLLAWFVAIVAAPVRTLMQTTLAAAALGTFLVVGFQILERSWLIGGNYPSSYTVALSVLLPVQAFLYLHTLYRTRRVPVALATLLLTSAGVLALGHGWRWSFMDALTPRKEPGPLGRRTDWPIRIEFLEIGGRALQWKQGAGQSHWALAPVRIHGLEPGVSLIQTGYDASVEDVSGIRRWGHSGERWEIDGYPAGAWMPAPTASLGCIGVRATHPVQVARLQHAGRSFVEEWKEIRRVRARLRFTVARWFVSQRAPLDGGQLQYPGGRIVGVRPRASQVGSVVTLRYERLMLAPFPSPPRPPQPPVLFDPMRADCLSIADPSYTGGGSFTLPIGVEEESAGQWSRGGRFREVLDGRPVPETTEMIFLGHEVLGTLEIPFEYLETTASR